jgi:ribonuclease HI
MSKKELELYLYKNRLSDKSFIDLLGYFSNETCENILSDFKNSANKDSSKENDTYTLSKNILYIFSDGNCKANGKTNAKAGYSIYFIDVEKKYKEELIKFNKTRIIFNEHTNNKAELSGILKIFKTLDENIEYFKKFDDIILCTDSMYSINCITKWYKGWENNNWKNSKGQDVKNKDLIHDILILKRKIQFHVSFKHVMAHTKEPINKDTLEHFLWYGNKKVDDNINYMLTS